MLKTDYRLRLKGHIRASSEKPNMLSGAHWNVEERMNANLLGNHTAHVIFNQKDIIFQQRYLHLKP